MQVLKFQRQAWPPSPSKTPPSAIPISHRSLPPLPIQDMPPLLSSQLPSWTLCLEEELKTRRARTCSWISPHHLIPPPPRLHRQLFKLKLLILIKQQQLEEAVKSKEPQIATLKTLLSYSSSNQGRMWAPTHRTLKCLMLLSVSRAEIEMLLRVHPLINPKELHQQHSLQLSIWKIRAHRIPLRRKRSIPTSLKVLARDCKGCPAVAKSMGLQTTIYRSRVLRSLPLRQVRIT